VTLRSVVIIDNHYQILHLKGKSRQKLPIFFIGQFKLAYFSKTFL